MAVVCAVLSEAIFATILFRHGRIDMMAGTIIDLFVYLFHMPALVVAALFSLKTPTHDNLVHPFTVVAGLIQFFVLYYLMIHIWSRRHRPQKT